MEDPTFIHFPKPFWAYSYSFPAGSQGDEFHKFIFKSMRTMSWEGPHCSLSLKAPGHCWSGRGSMFHTRLLSNRCFTNTYLTLKVILQGESQSLIQIRMRVSDRLSGCETGICFPGGSRICLQCRRSRRLRVDSWVGKRRA